MCWSLLRIPVAARVALAAATVASASPAAAQAPQPGPAVLIIDTPSGINRFVAAAHTLHRAETRDGGPRTRWILRTTRQVAAGGADSVRAWLSQADRAVIRLAVGETARPIAAALEGARRLPAPLWVFHSDAALVRRSRGPRGEPFLADRDDAWLRRAAEQGDTAGAGADARLRAWHHGMALVAAKGAPNAVGLLRFLAAGGAGAPPAVAASDLPERYPVAEGGLLPPDAPAVGILDFDSYALNSEAGIIDSLAAALRRRGMRPVPVVAKWGEATVGAMRRHFFAADGRASVDAVVSLQSFVLGGDGGRAAADSLLRALDVPVFRAIRLAEVDPDAWAASGEGIPWAAVYHQVAMPELQGTIEPLVVAAEATAALDPLTGARRAVYAPIPAQVELLTERVGHWTRLRRTAPAEKRVALIYYNHPPGKQNIGADNLNVTATVVRLLALLRGRGYAVGESATAAWGRDPDSLASRLVRRGINVGAYGTAQIDSLAEGGAVLLPAEQYAEWFARLPRLVRREIVDGPLGYLEALLEDHADARAAAPAAPDPEDRARLARAEARLADEMTLVFGQMRDFFSAFEPDGPEQARGPAALDGVERAARAVVAGTASLREYRAAKERFRGLRIEALSGWGPPPGDVMTVRRGGRTFLVIPGVQAGNVFIGPQPQRGFAADPEKVHSSTLVAPPHHYLAFYAYLAHEFGANALVHLGRHSSYEWLPRKQVGLSHADHPVAVLHGLPSVYLYTVDGVGEGLQAKRRGLAALIDHLTPPIKTTELYGDLLELQQMADQHDAQKAPERRRDIVRRIRERLAEPRLADLREEIERENGSRPVAELDDDLLVHEVGHELGAMRETMMPFGLHTFATAWTAERERMLARSMAAMQVDTAGPGGAARRDSAEAAVVELLRESFRAEGDAFLRALEGRRIEPGPGNDPIRTPAVLPTGRNFHALDASLVPTRIALDLGGVLAGRSLDALREERGDSAFTPARVSAVLWAVETTRDDGSMVGWVLHMLGVAPQWDARGKVKGLRRVPLDSLGRARVDVTLVTSGLFRDLYAPALHLLDDAARLALAGSARALAREHPTLVPALRGALRGIGEAEWGDEPLSLNPIARHWADEAEERVAALPAELRADSAAAGEVGRRAADRIFGPAVGGYGAGINYLVGQSWSWRERGDLADHYLGRMQYAYGADGWGRPGGADGLARKLRGTDASFHSRSSNLYGVVDNDDFFDYFGGLSLAAERVNGRAPSNFILHSSNPRRVEAERLQTFLGRELRARYYNPEWIRGQMAEGYDGARTVSNKFVEFLWGWQVTNPDVVRPWMWDEIQDVYLEDKHGLGVDRWMAEGDRAYAMENVAAVLMVAAHRGFWRTDPARLRRVADRLGALVAEHGTACSSHLCGDVEAMAFAEAQMSPERRGAFRAALREARGGDPEPRPAPVRRDRPERSAVASPAPAALPPASSGMRATPEGGAAPQVSPDEARHAAVPAAPKPRSRVREVIARARRAAESPWGWAAAAGLALLLAAFGAGVFRARRTES